jgi:hypothetical protein
MWVAQQGDRLPLKHGGPAFLQWVQERGHTVQRAGNEWAGLFRLYQNEPTRR